jgi:site-specific DNA-cytosine methylase
VDSPAFVVKTNGGRASQAGSMLDLRAQGNRIGSAAAAACTVTAKPSRVGAGASHVLNWPWSTPSTDVLGDPRIPAPGHHAGSFLSQPNAVVLSELAATILQGFPESWCFSGATKRARWSQLGQAMPPPLAEAVARSVLQQLKRTQGRTA